VKECPVGKTLIKASHIIAFDRAEHRYLLDGQLVYEGDAIVRVGRDYQGRADDVIDATGKIVINGRVVLEAQKVLGLGARNAVPRGGVSDVSVDVGLDRTAFACHPRTGTSK
jgi:hypothetical protein